MRITLEWVIACVRSYALAKKARECVEHDRRCAEISRSRGRRCRATHQTNETNETRKELLAELLAEMAEKQLMGKMETKRKERDRGEEG